MTEPSLHTDEPMLEPGARLGDFEIEGPLGRGGMGIVYVARQLSLGGRPVALKVLRTEHADDESRRRFRREVQVLAGLHHENLAEVHGFGEAEGRLFYAMQLVEGPTLHDVILEERTTGGAGHDPKRVRRCVRWVADVAAALALVHEQGLVHRDVKPANVVLDATALDRAVLVDFGLVRAVEVDSVSLTANPAATLAFAPTEQILGRRPGPASDVFALGVTLHDLLTSRRPRDRQQASVGLEPLEELIPGVEPDLAAVVAKATDPMAQWRYAHAGEFERDLEAWLAGRSVEARRPPRLERIERWVRSHPARIARSIVGFIGAVLIVVGVSTALAWVRAARSATRAEAETDLVEFARQASSIPALLQSALLRNESGDLARRLRDGSGTDPIALVADDLERGDVDAAILEAVTSLRRDGLAAQPVLVRFLERSIRAELGAGPGHPTQRVSVLFQLVGRLFYERPDATPSDQVASGPIRDALLSCFNEFPPGRSRDRGYVLTALSGCGRTEDVSRVIPAALDPGASVEDHRLATRCIERMVRRAHRCGGLSAERVTEWIRSLGEVLVARRHGSDDFGRVTAANSAIEALAFAARAVDRRPEIGRLLASDIQRSDDIFDMLVPRVLEGDPARMGSIEHGFGDQHAPATWGFLVPLIEPKDLARRIEARARKALESSPGQLSEFELGIARGRDRTIGIRADYNLDRDSLLGFPSVTDDLLELSMLPVRAKRPGGHWRLDSSTPTVAGMATGLSYRNGTFHSVAKTKYRSSYLRLWAFGRSAAWLHFDIESPGLTGAWSLKLWHVAAARDYYPGRGEAYLEVFLDDRPIGEVLLPHYSGGEWTSLPTAHLLVPLRNLRPGPHFVELRLSSRTTTTYRLVGAELAPAPLNGK